MAERAIVVAVGGNALAPAGEEGTITEQFRHTRESLSAVVELARGGWRIALVHGNGPQVGNALIQQEAARHLVSPLPLGVLVAATQGWIGYMIQQSLVNALATAGVLRSVVSMVTQVLVDRSDPAFGRPTKPIGRTMDERTARKLADELGWEVAKVSGGWRRVVASPTPVEIVEGDIVRSLLQAEHIVIAAGGGGTPVYRDDRLGLEGVDAVVDKDRAAAVLAGHVGAMALLILTDVDHVYTGFGTPEQKPLRRIPLGTVDRLLASGELGAGSMAPKVEAAAQFIREGGSRAIIAGLNDGERAVAGLVGTEIVR